MRRLAAAVVVIAALWPVVVASAATGTLKYQRIPRRQ